MCSRCPPYCESGRWAAVRLDPRPVGGAPHARDYAGMANARRPFAAQARGVWFGWRRGRVGRSGCQWWEARGHAGSLSKIKPNVVSVKIVYQQRLLSVMASFAHGKQASSSGWGSLVLTFGAGGWPGPAQAHVTHMAKSDVPQRDSAVPQSFGTPPRPPQG